jgi:hypothetical protein
MTSLKKIIGSAAVAGAIASQPHYGGGYACQVPVYDGWGNFRGYRMGYC